MEQVSRVTMIRWLQVVQHERAKFFTAQVKLVRDPIRRHACGVIGKVLLLSLRTSPRWFWQRGTCLSSVQLASFGGWCLGVGGRGPQALGIRRPQRSGVRGVTKGVF